MSVVNFLRSAYNAVHGEGMSALAFHKLLREKMELLGVEDEMVKRYVNQGFSGGEKKKNEVLQLAVLEPKIAVLDETDSGLDIDSLKSVAEGVARLIGPSLGILLITHYQRILNYIKPDHIHVMMDGRIVLSGGPELAHDLEQKGYEGLRAELGLEAGERRGERHERRGWTSNGSARTSRSSNDGSGRTATSPWSTWTAPTPARSRARSSTRSPTTTSGTTPTSTGRSTRSPRRPRRCSRPPARSWPRSSARPTPAASCSTGARPSR